MAKKLDASFYGSISEERDKENAGNMSGHHFYEFKIGHKNEDTKKNRDSLEDPRVFYMDRNVMACEVPEIIISNYKDVTYHVVKDICVDEDVPMMQESFLFSKIMESVQDSSKLDQDNLIVTGQEVKNDSEVSNNIDCDDYPPMRNVAVTSRSVSKEALTLGDIISMENSQNPPNNININGREENVDHEAKQEKKEEPKSDNLRDLNGNSKNRKKSELKNRRLNHVPEDSYDDHNFVSSKFPNGFGERSFSEAESGLAHITYSGSFSVAGSISVRSDGSTISASSFAFPILQSEWNSSPVRMVKAERALLREDKGWRHYSFLLCCRF